MGVCCPTLIKNQVVHGERALNPVNLLSASQDVKANLVEAARSPLLQISHCCPYQPYPLLVCDLSHWGPPSRTRAKLNLDKDES
jgi:hypothetical protein